MAVTPGITLYVEEETCKLAWFVIVQPATSTGQSKCSENHSIFALTCVQRLKNIGRKQPNIFYRNTEGQEVGILVTKVIKGTIFQFYLFFTVQEKLTTDKLHEITFWL